MYFRKTRFFSWRPKSAYRCFYVVRIGENIRFHPVCIESNPNRSLLLRSVGVIVDMVSPSVRFDKVVSNVVLAFAGVVVTWGRYSYSIT